MKLLSICLPFLFMSFIHGLGASSLTLAWDRSSSTNVVSYNVHYQQAGSSTVNSSGPVSGTTVTIPNIAAGVTYSFWATATDTTGLESQPSNLLIFQATTNPPPVIPPVYTNVISNPSFESGTAGWTFKGNVGVFGMYYRCPPPDGSKLVVFGSSGSSVNGKLNQVFSFVPGKEYALTFLAAMGFRGNYEDQVLGITVTAGSSTVINGTAVVSRTKLMAPPFKLFSYTFVPTQSAGSLTLQDKSSSTLNVDLLLDKVFIAQTGR